MGAMQSRMLCSSQKLQLNHSLLVLHNNCLYGPIGFITSESTEFCHPLIHSRLDSDPRFPDSPNKP